MRRNWIAAPFVVALMTGPVVGDDFNSPEWKSEIAQGYLPYRKLTYDDFPIANGIPTPHLMHTQGFLHYSYKAVWTEEDGTATAKISQIVIRSGFDQNKSWQQSGITEAKALLDHEQGHLDINELHAYDFRKAKLPTGTAGNGPAALEDLKAKIKSLGDKCQAESVAEQEQYDKDTNHGTLADQQSDWTRALRKRLENAHITYWDSSR